MADETVTEQLSKSILYLLASSGELTSRQLSDKLNTNTTDVAIALTSLYRDKMISRKVVWQALGGKQFVYSAMGGENRLKIVAQTPAEKARYVMLQSQRVARLTDGMYAQVQRHGADRNTRMQINGPNPATNEERMRARNNGIAIPIGQYIYLDIVKYTDDNEPSAYGLEAPNRRTVDALLIWWPEFKLG